MPHSTISYRPAGSDDIEAMKSLLLEHGPNEWNYLPCEEVTSHLEGIATGESYGYVANEQEALVGLVTYVISDSLSGSEPILSEGQPHGWIVEGVVNRELVGKGIGMQLTELCIQAIEKEGISQIYVERHEENLASAAVMRRAGFVEVETFYDPDRRQSGSRKTTVCRLTIGLS